MRAMLAWVVLGAVVVVASTGCETVQATSMPLPRERATECYYHCQSLGMELGAVVIMMNHAGCVCQPPPYAPPPGVPQQPAPPPPPQGPPAPGAPPAAQPHAAARQGAALAAGAGVIAITAAEQQAAQNRANTASSPIRHY